MFPQFRPYEENRVPSYIIQDDFADMPYEMFSKDMEIPDIKINLDFPTYEFCELYVVPERLKRRVVLDKKYKNREKVGSISIDLDEALEAAPEDEEFDDLEQMYFQKESQCKYKYMYGSQDMRDFNILQIPSGKNDKEKRLLIEIPEFRNHLMYNLLAVKLLELIKPTKVFLFVEETESTAMESGGNTKGVQMMKDLVQGKYRGPGGELGMRGITASFLNRLPLERVGFVVVARSADTMKTMYL